MSKEGQPGTDMIGLQDSVLASGPFCANYRTFGRSCLFNFPVNFIAYLYCLQMVTRILAPTMYIFFASALPVIAFGEQLSTATSETTSCQGRSQC